MSDELTHWHDRAIAAEAEVERLWAALRHIAEHGDEFGDYAEEVLSTVTPRGNEALENARAYLASAEMRLDRVFGQEEEA